MASNIRQHRLVSQDYKSFFSILQSSILFVMSMFFFVMMLISQVGLKFLMKLLGMNTNPLFLMAMKAGMPHAAHGATRPQQKVFCFHGAKTHENKNNYNMALY